MEKLTILCIEDQREVLHAIVNDLAPFLDDFAVEECESAAEARELLDEIDAAGDYLALVISDHVMPGESGVEFLSALNEDPRFEGTRKILLTGLATHEDTIRAINQAAIDRYLEKPWSTDRLQQYVKELLTEFILERGIDYQKFLPYLDQETLFAQLRKSG